MHCILPAPYCIHLSQRRRIEQAAPRRERLEMPNPEHVAQVHVEGEASRSTEGYARAVQEVAQAVSGWLAKGLASVVGWDLLT